MNVIAKKLKGGKTLVYLLAAVFALWADAAWAADWTDASGNEYTALKYVKGNATDGGGGPWMVLTNITAQCTDTVKMKFKLVDTFTQGLWCSRKTSASHFSAFYSVSSNRRKISFYRKNGTAAVHSKVLNANDECTVIADYNACKFTVNGETKTLSFSDSGSYDVGPIMLFGTYVAGTDATYSTAASNYNRGSYYLYYFQIYSSTGTLRHNLLPATNMTAQTVGLFDTVTRTFYTPDYSTCDFKFTTAEYDNYAWGGGAAANWSDANVWMNADAAATWADNNNAIFNTANATVTLDNDVSAWKVAFNEDATIVTNGTDEATLTVPTVSVAQNVSATIAAPTAGALEKNGEGTLTLTENRTDATTITAGTLKMDGATVSDLTLGTNGGAPVVFDYGGQSLEKNPADYLVTGSDVTLTNGTFGMSGKMEIRDSTKIPAVLTIAKDATLQQASDYNLTIDNTTGTATVNVVGGTLAKTTGTDKFSYLQHASLAGRLNINVTDGGLLTYSGNLYALCGGNNGSTPSLYMMFSDSAFHVGDVFHFGSHNTKVSTAPTGVLAATNSTININTTFNIGRNTQDEKSAGSFTADFENCIVSTRWFSVYHDRPLNNARFNKTRFVFGGSGAIITSDGADNWITVGDNGLTLDTQAYTCELRANLGGSGAVEKVGSGTLTVSRNQTASAAFTVNEGTLAVNGGVSISRPMAVASGATLKVNATDTASISSLTPAAGSTLDIASYNGKTPLALTSLTLPADGTVNLTLNGGAFPQGVYAIYAKSGAEAADGEKFAVETADDLAYTWSVVDDRLLLTVGELSGNFWTGLGDGVSMSDGANWLNGAPAAGADIDFTGVAFNRTINADAGVTYGRVTMGPGVVMFTNALSATSFNDTSKIVVDANSTVTIDGDLEFSGSVDECIVNYVAAGGRFVVSGDIKAMPGKNGFVYPCVNYNQFKGTIVAKGLVNNSVSTRVNRFALTRGYDNTQVNWAVGEHGISGTDGFWKPNDGTIQSTITAEADFRISSEIAIQGPLTLDTKTHTIEITGDTARRGICGETKNSSATSGAVTITGAGRVVLDYDVNNLTTKAAEKSNPFTVLDTATLALKPGSNIGTGQVSVTNGATLAICESGTVTLGGDLTLDSGAALAFNFTKRGVVPQLALAEGQSVVFAEGESTNITVKILGDVWPMCGEKVLTTCGGFDTEGVSVSLAAGAPKWAKSLSVNDGNIVLDVKPKPMILIVR